MYIKITKQFLFVTSIYLLSAFSSWGMEEQECNVVQRYGSLTEWIFTGNTYVDVQDQYFSAFMRCITNRPVKSFWLLFEKGASDTFLKALVEALKENNRSINRLYFDKNFISEHALEILKSDSNLNGPGNMAGRLLFVPKFFTREPKLPNFNEVEFQQRVESKQNELWENQTPEEIEGPEIRDIVIDKVLSETKRIRKAYDSAILHYQKQGYIGHWQAYAHGYHGMGAYYYRFSANDDGISKTKF